jgi:sigma-B regulation protein RsbU (phosphoserine phosphatase)
MSAAPSRLLVADDNEDNRYTLVRRLAREGWADIVTASNGSEALALLRSRPVDHMLLDNMMPVMNGYEVLERLKADTELCHMPVIMISAVEELDSVVRCIELGAEDYLLKPFNATLLRARVHASLEKKRLRDEVRSSLARLERELKAARTLQLSMLPGPFPSWTAQRPLSLHASMRSASEVGGDIYDHFAMDDGRVCFMVGDVSGKGAAAAMFMARMRSLVRLATGLWARFTPDRATPSKIVRAVNAELFAENGERMFVTLLLGFIDTASGQVAYTNAGHPAAWVIPADGPLARLAGPPEPPIGVRPDVEYSERSTVLTPGEILFAFTDGVTEAASDAGDLFGDERLEAVLEASRQATPAQLVAAVDEAVARFTGEAAPADDMTMLALQWQPLR